MSQTRVVFDLNKATKNLAGMVQVQRMVTRNGKTFAQHFWVLPSQVKPTDKVLSTNSSNTTFDLSKFDNLKTSNRDDALKYLESCGVTWTKSPHAGINWMRACMAAKKAAGKPVQQGGKPKIKVASKQQSTPQTTTGKTYDLSSLSSTFDTLSGKDKVNALKTVISKEDLFTFAKNAGVTWDEHQHAGINNMRMQMALAAWADSHSLADCKPLAVIKSGGNPALAKMPNKKDKAVGDKKDTKSKSEPKKPSDQLEIPTSATQRQKSIIEMVNKVSSKSDLDMYKTLGMIAEDDQAKTYLEKTLLPNVLTNSGNSAVSYSYDTNGTVVDGLLKTMKGFNVRLVKKGIFDYLCHSLDSRIFTAPRDAISINNTYAGKPCMSAMGEYVVNHQIDGVRLAGGYGPTITVSFMLESLRAHFGEYSCDRDNGIYSVQGYTNSWRSQFNFEKAIKTFDPKSDGVCVVLTQIAESQPELKDTAESMKKSYIDLVNLCDNDFYALFSDVLQSSDDMLKDKRDTAKKELEQSDAMKEVLKDYVFKGDTAAYESWLKQTTNYGGYADVPVSRAQVVSITIRNQNYDYTKPIDDTNWRIKEYTVDLSNITLSNGKKAKDVFESHISSYVPIFSSEITEKSARRIAEGSLYTTEARDKAVSLICDMFGMEIKDHSYKNSWGADKQCKLFTPKDDSKRDAIITNLLHMDNMVESKNNIARKLMDYYTNSKLNGNGEALENVFNWINTDRTTYVIGSTSPTDIGIYQYSAKKLSEEDWLKHLKAQHKQTKVYSEKELQDIKTNLIDFNEGRYSQTTSYSYYTSWSNPNYAYVGGYGSGLDVYNDSSDNKENMLAPKHPLFSVMMDDLYSVALNNPACRNTRVKTDADVIKTLKGHLGVATKADDEYGDEITKTLRESTLKAIKCSLSTLPDTDYKSLQHKVKMDWDQVVHGRNSAVFHGAYKINNLEQEEKFQAACKRMNEKPQKFYHGTSFEGTQGILGNTGHFRVPKNSNQVKAGAMLGYGIYLASKSSKSAQYFRGYNNGRYGCGTLLICDAILGKQMPYVGSSSSPTYDTKDGTVCATTALNSRFYLMNDEWAVRNEDFVMPRILVDMENARRK